MTTGDLAARLLSTFVAELDEQVRALNAELLALEGQPDDRERLQALFRVAHTLKGAARAANVPLVEDVCHRLETRLADARDGRAPLDAAAFDTLFAAADALADAGARLAARQSLDDSPLASLAERLRHGKPVAPHRPAAAPPQAPPPPRQAPEPERAPAPTPPAGQTADDRVRVPAEKLDALVATAGQLLAIAGRMSELPAALEGALSRDDAALLQRVAGDARTLSLIATDVMERARGLRMLPFAEATQTLPRAARDVAAATGKEVALRIEGAGIEADRVILDALRDALLHLVRNAVDHGIEPPDERARLGKPRQGEVRVRAALRGDYIDVRVADDGRGLDVAAIRERLRAAGRDVPADDQALAQVLFEGGFSTRAEATAISGRGVGLDVVRAIMARIRGTVDVAWRAGEGTTFVLSAPLTLATVRAMLVGVGPQLLAIPTQSVQRLLRVMPDEIRQVEGQHVLPTPDGPVPLATLARLLGPPLPDRPIEGTLLVVLLALGRRRAGVIVDRVEAEEELVIRPLEHLRKPVARLSGAALLPSGRVALLVNPRELVRWGTLRDAASALQLGRATPAERVRHRVLVVDDSITTRTLEQSVLEAAGYDVVTAVDGTDAWRVLQERGADVVVTDIEMPRMDGFALTEAIRRSRYKSLPIVLVTSLESPEHQARGLEAGADAYIVKSSFDQTSLLETIRQLLR